jgi:hypothetical protein
MFVPILDICHYYCEYAERIDHDYPSLAEIIRSYSLYGLNSHFSYAHGNGVGIYHGLNYDSNPDLCRNILRQITECDPGASLILEVNETDYRNRANAKSMLKMIDTILYQETNQRITKII